jgi:lipopolysaccharide transport system permease protein
MASPPREGAEPETIIRPPSGWQPINWGELWRFRELIAILAWRDIKVRYKQTVLGAAWAVLQPALMMVVFTIFFGKIGGLDATESKFPYYVFVYAGLLPWLFVSSAITNAANSVVGAERVITKIYFPRLALPISAVATALIDFGFAFGLLLVLMLWNSLWPVLWALLLVPLLLSALTLAALGAGILLAGLHVAYRDFRYVTPFLIQVGMFVTPSIYLPPEKVAAVHPGLRVLLALNPLNALISAFRQACLGEISSIDGGAVALAVALVVFLFLAGCLYFRRVEDWFADII